MRPLRASTPEPRMNVTPFIDVLLVLLIIFMATTSAPGRGLAADATGGAAAATDAPATIEVAVDANGYQIDGSPVSPARLATELRAAVAAGRTVVIVDADDAAPYADVVSALAAAESAGAARVGLRGAAPPPAAP